MPLRDGLAEETLAVGRARFPGLAVDAKALGAFIEKLPTDDQHVRLHAEDLYLAFACAAGAPGAAEALEQTYLVHVPAYIRRYGTDRELIDEVTQRLRWKLLLDQPPKIATYAGAGPLGAWIRIAAVRIAIDWVAAHDNRAHEAVVEESDSLSALAEKADPELEALRRRYGPALQDALRMSVEALSPRQRTLLWLHYGQRLNIDRLGSIHGVHRATVARWLSALQREILAAVREKFAEKWQVSESEFESLYRVVEKDLRISLSRLRPALSDEDLKEGLDLGQNAAG